MHKVLYFLVFLLMTNISMAQSDLGVKHNTDEAFDGYVLFENTANTYLINNCGEVLNTWVGINQTDNHTKFTVDGTMMYIKNNAVYEVDWNGNVVNLVTHGDPDLLLEYESILLPNKNYLCVARRAFTISQFMAEGYDPGFALPSQVDVVVELDRTTGEIVWEWNIIDHVIQQRDPNMNNYGILSENPQLINTDAVNTVDWNFTESFMINGMDYNPELDQIVLSVRKIGEIVVIDHSTTTEEAAGSTGGRYGKGGDILYRWGNPMNYGRGTADDRILYFQHNPNWVTDGPHKGKVIMFNNGLARPNTSIDYSSIPMITTPVDENGHYTIDDELAFEPAVPQINYDRNDTDTQFFSGYTSGAEVMPNQNIYVTLGQEGKLFEINPQGEVVWEYLVKWDDYIFRSEKYSKDHPIFEGKDLSPTGTVEVPSSSYNCELYTSVQETEDLEDIDLSQNFYQPEIIKLINLKARQLRLDILNVNGQIVQSMLLQETEKEIILDNYLSGYYIARVTDLQNQLQKSFKLVIVK